MPTCTLCFVMAQIVFEKHNTPSHMLAQMGGAANSYGNIFRNSFNVNRIIYRLIKFQGFSS